MKFLFFLLFFLFASAPTLAQSVTVAWDKNAEPQVTGYRVYVGTGPSVYSQVFDAGNNDRFTVPNLQTGIRYYFAVSAYAPGPLEGPRSIEISTVVGVDPPPPDPQPDPCEIGGVRIVLGTWTRTIAKNGVGQLLFNLMPSTKPITVVVTKLNGVEQDRVTGVDLRKIAGSYFKAPNVAGSYALTVDAFDANGCTDTAARPMTVVVQ